jgi:glycosyltransferase involved in cell wall biosynthesis
VRRNLGLDDTARIAIYHGNMAEFRGLEELVDAAPQLPPDVVVVMLGGGSARRALEERAERAGLTRRVRFHDSVPGEALRDILADADVGVVPIRAVVPNYFYSLPNKVFELMSAHRPMVAADLPEIRAVVEDNGLGLIFDPDDPRDIARAITTLLDSPEREAYARRAGAASATHNWQAERSKLLRLYAGLELPATRVLRAAPQRATP